jgi:NodT family efflux transporter outer membrane factor (OMF) lipoprotein
VLLAALAGCTVGPVFEPPAVDAPRNWGPTIATVPSSVTSDGPDPRWWRSFNDPELNSLINRAVAQNLDLKTAAERILQGRSERDVVALEGLPHIREQSSYERFRYSTHGNPLGLVVPRPGATPEVDVYQNGFSSSWELDLFGRVRRGVEAANARTQSAVEDRNGVTLATEAELAQDYLSLRGTQALLVIAEGNLALAQENVRLADSRRSFGTATTLETAQARAQQEVIAERLPPLLARQAATINAIGLLLAEQPRALEAELRPPSALPTVPRLVPVGLPATLVRRRPDIRRAEAGLHAAVAQTGVAVASFYPDVSLAGTFALNSFQFKDAFSLYSRMFQVGPQVSIPIFQGGQLRGTLRLRESQQREAAITFQKTLLQAWREVDDALTDYAQAQARQDHAARAVAQSQAALAAARERFAAGAASFLNVTSAQAQLLGSQDDLATSGLEAATDLVRLYRALGGGWKIADATSAAAP